MLVWFVRVDLQQLNSSKNIFSARVLFFFAYASSTVIIGIAIVVVVVACCCAELYWIYPCCFLAKSISSPLHHLSFRCSRR